MGNLLSCIRPEEGKTPPAKKKGKRPSMRRNKEFREVQLGACVTEKLPTIGNQEHQCEVSVSDEGFAEDEFPVSDECLPTPEKAPSTQSTPRSGRKACSANPSTQPQENTTSVHMARGEPDDQTMELILKAQVKYGDGDNDEDVKIDNVPAPNCDKEDEDDFIHPSPNMIYQHNAETFSSYSEYLEKVYTEQYCHDQSPRNTLPRQPDDDTSVEEETDTANEESDTTDDDTDTPDIDDEYNQAYDRVTHILERLLDHVEDVIEYRENYNGYGSDDSVATDDISVGRRTPPEIEGEIYYEMGILKKRLTDENCNSPRRSISWGTGVKAPANDLCYLALVSNDFMQERQRLMMQKHRNIESAKLSCRLVNSRSAGLIAPRARIPTPGPIRRTPATRRPTPAPLYRPIPATYRPTPATMRPKQATYRPTPAPMRPIPAPMRPKPATYRSTPAPMRPMPAPTRPKPVTYRPLPATMIQTPATMIPTPTTMRPKPATYRPIPATYTPTPATYRPIPVTYRPTPAMYRPKQAAYRPSMLPVRSTTLPIRPTDVPVRTPSFAIKSYSTEDAEMIWPHKIDEIGNASAKKYFIEEFQKTLLYKEKLQNKQQGHSLWQRGLTPFQIWVVHNTGTVMMDKSTSTRPAAKRVKTAKSRISSWRGPGPPGSR